MADLPEDIEKLKRPELQRLCKRHNVKANMKNSEMIAALCKLRDESSVTSLTVEGSSDERTDKEDVTLNDYVKNNEQEDNVCERDSSSNNLQNDKVTDDNLITAADDNNLIIAADAADDNNLITDGGADTVEVIKDDTGIGAAADNTDELVKDDTSLDDTTNLVNVNSGPVNDNPVSNDEAIPNRPDISPITRTLSPVMESMETEQNHTTLEDIIVNEDNSPLPLVSIEEEEDSSSHNVTFTIEPIEEEVADPIASLSDSLCHTPKQSDFQPKGSWALRDPPEDVTKMMTPDKDPAIDSVKNVAMGAESPLVKAVDKENLKSHHDEILALLSSRVKERKNDPNYVPLATSTTSSTTSKIPVKSKITKKFDTAHRKEFDKMTSISALAERRKRVRPQEESTPTVQPMKRSKLDANNTRSETSKRVFSYRKGTTTSARKVVRPATPFNKDKQAKPPPFKF